ncbi:MAG: hypothetical protein AAFU85_23090 [Planctomycetota bacterium]
MLFGPTQPGLVQPTDEERKLMEDAEKRLQHQATNVQEARTPGGGFSIVGASVAVGVLVVTGLMLWVTFRLLL